MLSEDRLELNVLGNLLEGVMFESSTRDLDLIHVRQIVSDSRKAVPGALFVALAGEYVDGHNYIPEAIHKGAIAIVGERLISGLPVPYVRVKNSRAALAQLAAAYYGHPARKLVMIGITGTDGKTTTSNILYRILLTAGLKTGMISTVNALIGEKVMDTGFHVTTPDALDVQQYLARMVEAGLTHVILETTSHGWAQHRVDACEFDIGIITNITHEHLDYHGSYENYRAAKGRLFASLAETNRKAYNVPQLAILNRDDASYEFLSAITKVKQVTYGLDPSAGYSAERIDMDPDGLKFHFTYQGVQIPVISPLTGVYNVYNILAAMTAAVAGLGIDPHKVARALGDLPGVPGRMEKIDLGQDFTAIVDFAHTPNALRVAIEAGRQISSGKLIVVFGSAGLRDREKRRLMAEVAAELADLTILTAEDPRTEDLDSILDEMASGAVARGGVEGQSFWRIRDRGNALRFAVKLAQKGDILLACGKGHEQSMCFQTTEYPWDDRTALTAALSEALGIAGPPMPYLPTQDE